MPILLEFIKLGGLTVCLSFITENHLFWTESEIISFTSRTCVWVLKEECNQKRPLGLVIIELYFGE
jgi:hypothetical protein